MSGYYLRRERYSQLRILDLDSEWQDFQDEMSPPPPVAEEPPIVEAPPVPTETMRPTTPSPLDQMWSGFQAEMGRAGEVAGQAAQGVGSTLDRVWQRFQEELTPPTVEDQAHQPEPMAPNPAAGNIARQTFLESQPTEQPPEEMSPEEWKRAAKGEVGAGVAGAAGLGEAGLALSGTQAGRGIARGLQALGEGEMGALREPGGPGKTPTQVNPKLAAAEARGFEPAHVETSGPLQGQVHATPLGDLAAEAEAMAKQLDESGIRYYADIKEDIPDAQTLRQAVTDFGLAPALAAEAVANPQGTMARNVTILRVAVLKADFEAAQARAVLDQAERFGDAELAAAERRLFDAGKAKFEAYAVAAQRYSSELGRGLHALQIGVGDREVRALTTSALEAAGKADNLAGDIAKRNGQPTAADLARWERFKGWWESTQGRQMPEQAPAAPKTPQQAEPTAPGAKPRPPARAARTPTERAVDAAMAEDPDPWLRWASLWVEQQRVLAREAPEAGAREALVTKQLRDLEAELMPALREKVAKAMEKEAKAMEKEAAKVPDPNAVLKTIAARRKAFLTAQIKKDANGVSALDEYARSAKFQGQQDTAAFRDILDEAANVRSMESNALRQTAKERLARVDQFMRAGGDPAMAKAAIEDLRSLGTEARVAARQFRQAQAKRSAMKFVGSKEWQALPQAKRDEAINAFMRIGADDDARAVAALPGFAREPDFWSKLALYRVASMLSGTASMLVDISGNVTSTGAGVASRYAAGLTQELLNRGPGPKAAYASQGNAELLAMRGAWRNAASEAYRTLQTGISSREVRDIGTRRTNATWGGIITTWPIRIRAAQDDFFYQLNHSMAIAAEAERLARQTGRDTADILLNLVDHPEVVKRAGTEAKGRVLQADLSGILKVFDASRNNPLVRLVLPFFHTNANLWVRGWDHMPIWKQAKRGEWQALAPEEKADAIGRQVVGGTLMATFGLGALTGNVTGSGPTDAATREEWMAQGWRPYSVRVAGNYVDYRPVLSFLSIPVAMAANAVEAGREGVKGDWAKALTTFTVDYFRTFTDWAALRGLVNIADAMDDLTGRGWYKFVQDTATSFTPQGGFLGGLARGFDPGMKQPTHWMDAWETARDAGDWSQFLEALKARLPGLSLEVASRTGPLGETVTHGRQGFESIMPGSRVADQPKPVYQEYQRLRDAGYRVSLGRVEPSIKGVELRPKEREEYQQYVGIKLEMAITDMVNWPEYKTASDSERARALTRMEEKTRAEAADKYLKYLFRTGTYEDLAGRVERREKKRVLSGLKP